MISGQYVTLYLFKSGENIILIFCYFLLKMNNIVVTTYNVEKFFNLL